MCNTTHGKKFITLDEAINKVEANQSFTPIRIKYVEKNVLEKLKIMYQKEFRFFYDEENYIVLMEIK